jgi:hypothetical protein
MIMTTTGSSMQNDLLVYGAGTLAAALYALYLDDLERKYTVNPDGTILEVMGGVTITMTTALARLIVADRNEKRMNEMTGYDGWKICAWSFALTSLPISCWQGLRIVERHRETIKYVMQTGMTSYPRPKGRNLNGTYPHTYTLHDEQEEEHASSEA